MQWSKLKARLEERFSDSVLGVVEIHHTRYRHAHDGAGEVWITFRKKRIASMGDLAYEVSASRLEKELQTAKGCTDWTRPAQREGYYRAVWDAAEQAKNAGTFASWHVTGAIEEYLNISLKGALGSANPIIRALGMLDRRFGKRQLHSFDAKKEHPLVRLLYRVRTDCEEGKTRTPN